MRKSTHVLNVIGLLFLVSGVCTSCKKESTTPLATLENYTGNLKFEFQPQSVEKIFTAQMPWELRGLNYFNVVQQDSVWSMWYNSFAYNQLEFNGSFCFSSSIDGKSWTRPNINNNTNILLNGTDNKGVSSPFVFKDKDDPQYPYKMICTKIIDNEERTFLYSSRDGVKWDLYRQLYNMKQDSQFGVINLNGLNYIFSRYNDYSNGYQRAIGLSILDRNMNEIKAPELLLKADNNSKFPHIYNNAASKIKDSVVLLFPTYYNDADDDVRIKMIYTNNLKNYYLINDDINNDLFAGQNVNWAIVSPGVFPTGERNTYWVYYFTTPAKHAEFRFATNLNITYYRIKLVIRS